MEENVINLNSSRMEWNIEWSVGAESRLTMIGQELD